MYDAIVVGARCGGSPTAMLLAGKGFRVLLLDKGTFPSDTMSTLIIHYPGVRLLKKWGLLDRVMATGCPPIKTWRADTIEGNAFAGSSPLVDDVITIAPRRTVLDKILVDAAVAAGAELREGFVVDEFLFEGGRIAGIRGHTSSRKNITERASIVVGADGKHSKLAKVVNAEVYNDQPPQAFYYYTFWSGLPIAGIEYYWRSEHFVLAIPTHDGLTCLVVGQPRARFHNFRQDIERNYQQALEKAAPRMADFVLSGRREGRFLGTTDLPNFFRKPYGDGWALVGDAGLCMDPLGGYGIMNAFRDAELLSDALESGFSGPGDLGAALSSFEQQRNKMSEAHYERNWQGAKLVDWDEPPARELFETVRQDDEERHYYFGVVSHVYEREDFYAREKIARILQSVKE